MNPAPPQSSPIALTPGRERLLIVGLAIYFVTSLVSMAVMSIGNALFLLAVVIAFAQPGFLASRARWIWASSHLVRRYTWISVWLALMLTLSLVVARVAPMGYAGRFVEVSFFDDLFKIRYLFLPLVVAAAWSAISERSQRRVLLLWLGWFGGLSAFGVLQHFWGWPRFNAIPHVPGRFFSTIFLGHHLSVASIWIFPLFAAIDYLRRPEPPLRSRALWLVIVVLGTLVCFFTYSRMLWIALPIGLAPYVLPWFARSWRRAVWGGLVVSVPVALSFSEVMRRLNDGSGLVARRRLWEINWEFIKARPLVGTGWHHNLTLSKYYQLEFYPNDSWHMVSHAHNNVIEMLASTGVLGLVPWLVWSVFVVSILRGQDTRPRAATDLRFGAGLMGAWIVFQLNGLTQVNFWEAKVLHSIALMVGVSLAWTLPGAPAKPQSPL